MRAGDISANDLMLRLREKQAKLMSDLLSHPRADYASYREAVGQHRGIQDALDEIENLLQEEKNQNDHSGRTRSSQRHSYG